jgi:hypothetical protein
MYPDMLILKAGKVVKLFLFGLFIGNFWAGAHLSGPFSKG